MRISGVGVPAEAAERLSGLLPAEVVIVSALRIGLEVQIWGLFTDAALGLSGLRTHRSAGSRACMDSYLGTQKATVL